MLMHEGVYRVVQGLTLTSYRSTREVVQLSSVELHQNVPAQTRADEDLTEMRIDITDA